MDTLERLSIESELRALLACYAHLVDDGQVEGCAQLFAPDGVFAMGAQELRGPEAIAAWSRGRADAGGPRTRHIIVNSILEIEGPDRAQGRSDFLVMGLMDGALQPLVTGRYVDRFRKVEGQWRFERRDAQMLQAPPAGGH